MNLRISLFTASSTTKKVFLVLTALFFLVMASPIKVEAKIAPAEQPKATTTYNANGCDTTSTATCVTCEGSGTNCVTCSKQPNPAAGQVYCADPAASCNADTCDLVNNYLNPLISLLTAIVGIVVVISIIYGAIQYTSSGGDPQKVAKAKSHIVKTVVALLAYIFLFAFLQFLVPGGIIRN